MDLIKIRIFLGSKSRGQPTVAIDIVQNTKPIPVPIIIPPSPDPGEEAFSNIKITQQKEKKELRIKTQIIRDDEYNAP